MAAAVGTGWAIGAMSAAGGAKTETASKGPHKVSCAFGEGQRVAAGPSVEVVKLIHRGGRQRGVGLCGRVEEPSEGSVGVGGALKRRP